MALKTYKEFKKDKTKGAGNSASDVYLKSKEEELIEDVEKEYHLQHPDFPVVPDCNYILEIEKKKIHLEIVDGIIKTTDLFIKDKLIENGFYYLGYKVDGKPFI